MLWWMGSSPTLAGFQSQIGDHISLTRLEPRDLVPSSSAESPRCGGLGSRERAELGACLRVKVLGEEQRDDWESGDGCPLPLHTGILEQEFLCWGI